MTVETTNASLNSPEPEHLPARHISGFWSRLFGLLIDAVITGIPCALIAWWLQLLGWSFWNGVIDLGLMLAYFCVLGSTVGNGQTLGQRWTGIEIVDIHGKHLSPARSLLRYAIFLVPMSSIALPNWVEGLRGVAMLATTYLYVFNTRTRQTLHDVITGSYVVESHEAGPVEVRLWRGHWLILGALGAVMLAFTIWTYTLPGVHEAEVIQQALDSDEFQRVGVKLTKRREGSTSLQLQVACRRKPPDYTLAAAGIVNVVERADPQASERDVISISFDEGGQFGLLNYHWNKTLSHSPQEWERISKQIWGGIQSQ